MRRTISSILAGTALLFVAGCISGSAPGGSAPPNAKNITSEVNAVNTATKEIHSKVVAGAMQIGEVNEKYNKDDASKKVIDAESKLILARLGFYSSPEDIEEAKDRVINALKGNLDVYKKEHDAIEKTNADLLLKVKKLEASMSDAEIKRLADLETREYERKMFAQKLFTERCIAGASVLTILGVVLSIAKLYLPTTIPPRVPLYLFGFGFLVGTVPILSGQWWFAPVLGITILIALRYLFRDMRAAHKEFIEIDASRNALHEVVSGLEKYGSAVDKEADPVFNSLSKEMSKTSKELIKNVKSKVLPPS